MAPCIERAIAERALLQLGLITFQQLRALGASPKVVRRLVASGWLVRRGRSTFRLGGVASSFDGDVMAGCLDAGGIASHRAASRMHGYGPVAWRRLLPDVTVEKGRRHTVSPLACVHTSTNLGRDDLVVVRGVPTTSMARTIVGLAALVPAVSEEDLRDVIDCSIRDGKASVAWLWWRLEELRCRGRNGVSVLEAILAERDGRGPTELGLEREFLRLVDEAGYPRPEVQRRLRHPSGAVSRVDCLYRPTTVIELMGYRWHSTRRQLDAGADRRNRLTLAGYDVIEFTHTTITKNPEVVIATLSEKLDLPLPRGFPTGVAVSN